MMLLTRREKSNFTASPPDEEAPLGTVVWFIMRVLLKEESIVETELITPSPFIRDLPP